MEIKKKNLQKLHDQGIFPQDSFQNSKNNYLEQLKNLIEYIDLELKEPLLKEETKIKYVQLKGKFINQLMNASN